MPKEAIKDGTKLVDEILPINIVEMPLAKVEGEFYDVDGNRLEGYPLRLAIKEWSPTTHGKAFNRKAVDDFINLLNLMPNTYVASSIKKGNEPKTLELQYRAYQDISLTLGRSGSVPQNRQSINIARTLYDAYPHNNLLPIDAERDCRSLQSLLAKVTEENFDDDLFGFIVAEIVEDGESTLDGAIRALERSKDDMEVVLRALRDANLSQQ